MVGMIAMIFSCAKFWNGC